MTDISEQMVKVTFSKLPWTLWRMSAVETMKVKVETRTMERENQASTCARLLVCGYSIVCHSQDRAFAFNTAMAPHSRYVVILLSLDTWPM